MPRRACCGVFGWPRMVDRADGGRAAAAEDVPCAARHPGGAMSPHDQEQPCKAWPASSAHCLSVKPEVANREPDRRPDQAIAQVHVRGRSAPPATLPVLGVVAGDLQHLGVMFWRRSASAQSASAAVSLVAARSRGGAAGPPGDQRARAPTRSIPRKPRLTLDVRIDPRSRRAVLADP